MQTVNWVGAQESSWMKATIAGNDEDAVEQKRHSAPRKRPASETGDQVTGQR